MLWRTALNRMINWRKSCKLGTPFPAFGNAEIESCPGWITDAERLYEEINVNPGLRLMGRSNDAHLDSLRTV